MKKIVLVALLAGFIISSSNAQSSAVQFWDTTGNVKTAKMGWSGNSTAGEFFIETPGSKTVTVKDGNMLVPGTVTATKFAGDASGLTNMPAGLKGDTGPKGDTGVAGPVGPVGPAGGITRYATSVGIKTGLLLTGSLQTINSVYIHVPSNGIVLVYITGYVALTAKNAGLIDVLGGLTNSENANITSSDDGVWYWYHKCDSLPYAEVQPVNAHRSFSVNAESGNTFYFRAKLQNSGYGPPILKMMNCNMDAIFIPAAP